jgi:hypothetical protein
MRPQILLYEPVGDKLQLVGAEWFIPLATGAKERRLKPNPAGLFQPFNANVKCPKGKYTHTAEPAKSVPHR